MLNYRIMRSGNYIKSLHPIAAMSQFNCHSLKVITALLSLVRLVLYYSVTIMLVLYLTFFMHPQYTF